MVGASPTELELAEAISGAGGPALDAATAEVLGVFSRSDADPSRAVYTRADAFAALIESALAESESAAASTRGLKNKKGAADLGANCAAGGDCAAGVCASVPAGPAGSSSTAPRPAARTIAARPISGVSGARVARGVHQDVSPPR